MQNRPLVAIACCLMTGASVPSLWQGTWQRALALGCVVLMLAAGALLGSLTRKLALVCLAALLLGAGERLWAEHADVSALTALWEARGVPESAELYGVISTPPDVDGDVATFRFDAMKVKEAATDSVIPIRETVSVRIKLQSQEEQKRAQAWRLGDSLAVTGMPERPGDAGNFGAFDYRAYMQRQGIRWQWSVKGTDAVRPTGESVPWRLLPLREIEAFRRQIGRLTDKLYPEDQAGYMRGLVIGITEEVDPAQYDQFSRLGLTHVLAISGLHVGVVVFVLLRLGALCRLTRERSIDMAFAAMPFYMVITGASPSAVRACLMAMIALALARKHRLKDGLHLLAAAGMAMVVWDPKVVENVSFQLSFAVTAGLLLFTRDVGSMLQGIRPKFLRDSLAVGIAAQAVSLPLTVYYFHSLHLLSLPANLVIVPIVSFLSLPLGMASIVLGAGWLPLGMLPAALAIWANRLSFGMVEWLNRAEQLRLSWPQPSPAWVVLTYMLLAGTVWLWRRRRVESSTAGARFLDTDVTVPLAPALARERPVVRVWAAVLLLAGLWGGWWVWGYRPAFTDRHAYVQFFDVGQGDSILIRTGAGKHLLIDTGGTIRFRKPGEEWRERRDPYEIGRKLLVPLLRERGVRKLDALVLTHLDADHIGGAEAVLRDVPVGAIVWNGTWKENEVTARLFGVAEARGIPVYGAYRGERWRIDSTADLEVLYPLSVPEELQGASADAADSVNTAPAIDASFRPLPVLNEQNESSVVLRITLYGRTFLLPGDAEQSGEREIVALEAEAAKTRQLPVPIDVMKAAHHGSKTSTAAQWLTWWRPGETVISVGRNNLYGHPHPSVVERIEEAGSLLLRTDRDGEVQYRIAPDGYMQRRVKRANM